MKNKWKIINEEKCKISQTCMQQPKGFKIIDKELVKYH